MNPENDISKLPDNPYAPTSAGPISDSVLGEASSPTTLSRVVTYPNAFMCTLTCVFLGGCIFTHVLSAVSSYMQLDLLQGPGFTDEQASANDLREQASGILSLVLFILTAIVFSTWINRAHHNVRGFGAQSMTITPGWAVGYFFVPIMNLYRPYTAMSELWRASQSPGNWASNSAAGLVPVWWTLWILNLVLERLAQQVIKRANDLDSLILGTRFAIAVAIFGIPLALVAMQMVRKIQSMQDDWSGGSDRDGSDRVGLG